MGDTCTTGPSCAYVPRTPQETLLYEVLQNHLESFLTQASADGRTLPAFVIAELRSFLRCGVHAYGFNRLRCSTCRHEFAVPFSCKGRGFCPSCSGRHMAATAAHLVDHVLPDVPYRQWVLTLPFELRLYAAYDPELCSALLRSYVHQVRRWTLQQARALGVERPLWGGVTVTQRFGSDLRLNPHFHTATPDGVFALNATGDSVEFVRVPAPSTEDISAIVGRVHRYAVRLLSRRGLFADDGEAPLAEPVVSPDDAALGQCYGGALTGRAAFGPTAGQPSGRLGRLLRSTPPQELGPRCARSHGFNLHARAKRDGAKRSRDGSWRRSGRPRAALPLPDAPPILARAARAPR